MHLPVQVGGRSTPHYHSGTGLQRSGTATSPGSRTEAFLCALLHTTPPAARSMSPSTTATKAAFLANNATV